MPTKPRPVPPLSDKLVQRFWSYVDPSDSDGCWPWTGSRNDQAYGHFHIPDCTGKEHVYYAHRLAWRISRGTDCRLCVLHRCDNPPCCRPDHLFEGTYADNVHDAVGKERMNWKENHPFRLDPSLMANGDVLGKLTRRQVLAMRNRRAKGASLRELMERFGASNGTVFGIVHGQLYKHVGGPIEDVGEPAGRYFTEDQVHEIIALRKSGLSMYKIADRFNVQVMTIQHICSGQTYTEIVSTKDVAEMAGVKAPHRFQKSTPEAIARMRELRALGWSYDRIGIEVGMTGSSVKPHVLDMKVKAIRG